MGSWSDIHDEVLMKIFSYLSIKDRLNASSTCQNWRKVVCSPYLWRRVEYVIENNKNTKQEIHEKQCEFLEKCVITTQWVKEATLNFHPNKFASSESIRRSVQLAKATLEGLANNDTLKVLRINLCNYYTHGTVYTHDLYGEYQKWHVLQEWAVLIVPIRKIIQNAEYLKFVSLGGIGTFLKGGILESLLLLLQEYHGLTLESLHIATLAGSDTHYPAPNLSAYHFEKFVALQRLSLDYSYLSEDILHLFCTPSSKCAPLLRLNVYFQDLKAVKGRIIADEIWRQLKSSNPELLVTFTFLCFVNDHIDKSECLQPQIPLDKFLCFAPFDYEMQSKSDFTKTVQLIGANYISTLTSLRYVKLEDDEELAQAFVELVKNCVHLTDCVIIGCKFYMHQVIEMAKARGTKWRTFIIYYYSIDYLCGHTTASIDKYDPYCSSCENEVTEILGSKWKPWNSVNEPLEFMVYSYLHLTNGKDILLESLSKPL